MPDAVFGSYGLVWAGDRFWKAGLAQPIGFGVVGTGLGLLVSMSLVPLIGWNLPIAVTLAAVCTAVCGWFGVRKQSRELRLPEERILPENENLESRIDEIGPSQSA